MCLKGCVFVLKFFSGRLRLAGNVRRYVALAQSRGGACFCTRGAMQGYDGYYFILALAKTVTPGGSPRREPGQAAPLTTQPTSSARRFSRCGAPMTYTDLLAYVKYPLDMQLAFIFSIEAMNSLVSRK